MAGRQDHGLGFGSEYEKFILCNIVKEMVKELNLRSVCEYPTNNLMGDNSEVFSGLSLKIDRLSSPRQASGATYDLVWNFCEIEQQASPTRVVKDMLSLTRRYLLIVVQNRRNPGVPLHMIYHKLTGREWNHGNIASMTLDFLVNLLSNYGRIVRADYFDVPWFVLDIYEAGNLLRKLVPKSVAGSMLQIRKSRFEGLPLYFKKRLAHHIYVLFEKH